MKIVRSLAALPHEKNSVVTVGTFDGVHVAHREIIRDVVNRARTREGRSVVVTFDPHPKEVVPSSKGPVSLLTTLEERITLLGSLNVDLLYIIAFTREFSLLTATEFYRTYVVEGVGVGEVVVGYDHMFGRNREAGIEELLAMGRTFDFSVFAVHPYSVDGALVSSTRIRRLLLAGDVEHARELLTVPYQLRGIVVHGDGRGSKIGFPTANLDLADPKKVVPGRGVYAVGVAIGGKVWGGMLNIGVRPTVSDSGTMMIEVHIFDFSGNLYGQSLSVSFYRKLREERRFPSLEDLTAQLREDRVQALRAVAEFVKI